MSVLDYIWLGILAGLQGPEALLSLAISITVVMVISDSWAFWWAQPPGWRGLAMAISLPILISPFGYVNDALSARSGIFDWGYEGATVGGAVPAICSTPGTPDVYDNIGWLSHGQTGRRNAPCALHIFHPYQGIHFQIWC